MYCFFSPDMFFCKRNHLKLQYTPNFFLTLKEYFDRSDILYTNNLDKKEK